MPSPPKGLPASGDPAANLGSDSSVDVRQDGVVADRSAEQRIAVGSEKSSSSVWLTFRFSRGTS